MAVGRTNRPRQQAFEIDRLTGPRYNFDNQMTTWTTLDLPDLQVRHVGPSAVLSDRLADLCLDTVDRPA